FRRKLFHESRGPPRLFCCRIRILRPSYSGNTLASQANDAGPIPAGRSTAPPRRARTSLLYLPRCDAPNEPLAFAHRRVEAPQKRPQEVGKQGTLAGF